ncbi:uncharacterized protein SAPINGB_P004891 [Magnusiomyces paraingens]|uniref:Chromo domain-containing protein n=1 Tax=Magnusiomyces paraingens TaxID=2606893 RepID=A0A5E8BYQ6_9ASCO|nr:uncharacterized protein SAPINGB_P004891 [Saprochaete ingens]VVT56202.1 unnamed protein product [Saprochaete ingens]
MPPKQKFKTFSPEDHVEKPDITKSPIYQGHLAAGNIPSFQPSNYNQNQQQPVGDYQQYDGYNQGYQQGHNQGYTQDNRQGGYNNTYQGRNNYRNNNFQSKNFTNRSNFSSGASTPQTANSSSTSLSSLASALKEVEQTPIGPSLEKIGEAKAISEVLSASGELVDIVCAEGPDAIEKFNLEKQLTALSKSKSSPLKREAASTIISKLARKFGNNTPAEAYLASVYTIPFDLLSDKDNSVKRAAQSAIDSLYTIYQDDSKLSVILPTLLKYLESPAKWQGKLGALKQVLKVIDDVPQLSLENSFLQAVPILTNCMNDIKPELAKEGAKVLTEFVQKVDNQDIHPRIPIIIKTLADPKKVPECIKAFSQVTFVAEVTESALAILVPILFRALNQAAGSQDLLRQTVIVVENLTRLVHNPIEIKPFIPELLPGIKKVVDTASQPEVRNLGSKALKVLEDAQNEESVDIVRITLEDALEKIPDSVNEVVRNYVANLVKADVNYREFARLAEVLKVYLPESIGTEEYVTQTVSYFRSLFRDSKEDDDGQEGIKIVNAEFSLAYGGRMLLNKTVLKLYKGHRYGIVGRNGAGKSTLMRSISLGKLEGFPDKSEVRTCFVEHKLQGEEGDMDLVSFIASDPELESSSKEEIAKALEEVGFDDYRRSQNVGSLSGGWKMKLELARAMLMKADILLLDEPTNHLDVSNVKWLQDYLVSHTDITSLIVTHDSGFLDAVCTDIIHYENKKLVYYPGNLSDFVKVRPEGKSYYTLTDSIVKMNFPPPGILAGVRSNTRSVARMTDVTFTYPGASKPSLSHVSCSLSLSSRVAILGPNGAGKSTLIKLLTGELIPDSGSVEKHPNLRIGYIAQHALQHVELHKEKTPSQYLQWRYQNGDDREIHMKKTRATSKEEEEQMSRAFEFDGREPRVIENIIGRQKLKKNFRYEVKWKGWMPKFNSWIPKETLIEWGFAKALQRFDDHEASREGLGYRDLSPPVIRKHFEDVGLDGDIADHTALGSLSGGQLVKVVIAGAMWNNPHLLVLDEPTNYLDRDSLGGLAHAIRDWTGGVIMISHNNEFVGALCPEQWVVEDGKLMHKGKSAVASDRFDDSTPSTTQSSAVNSDADNDSPANIKIKKKKKKMTRNELKEREVRRRLRHLEWLNSPKGTPKPPDTDDEEE